jgi:hypothetical protein
MRTARQRINRVLLRPGSGAKKRADRLRSNRGYERLRTTIDFSSLELPQALSAALSEAFWSQAPARSPRTLHAYWRRLTIFDRFVAQTRSLSCLGDVRRELFVRYVEWLNTQRRSDGTPWSKGTRYGTYMSLITLLQWIQRCRPDVLGEVEFPHNPFPWKNRDTHRTPSLSAERLRAILRACEEDIAQLRRLREDIDQKRAAARASNTDSLDTLGALLEHIDQQYAGIIPLHRFIKKAARTPFAQALQRLGGPPCIEPLLYPRATSLLPYYLAILIHTAGNPVPIAELTAECLQAIPLIEDRQLLVWRKARADVLQRRAFSMAGAFEPPALVREIVQWTQRLRSHARTADRDRLFLYKGANRITALSLERLRQLLPTFIASHRLPRFTLAALRPSVLTAFYRNSGDLSSVKAIANHAHLSTTVGYVQAPEVQAQNRLRVAAIQRAYLGSIEPVSSDNTVSMPASPASAHVPTHASARAGSAVSMFGFDCKDPFAGVAPGTHRGELCTHFLGCFTCPNAVIAGDTATLARLMQARDHLRTAAAYLHPARWSAVYEPPLRVLEEDILTRFPAGELARAERLRPTLPALLPLR